ncbi:MAG: serine/threonine protein kinase, partial [Myxococcales bacterium]|nr:serine/threonine protein kinase [Myxococcales bacterium]
MVARIEGALASWYAPGARWATAPGSGFALGPFVLEEPIGQGAMGAVWSARHTTQHVRVAIKVLHPPSASSDAEEFLAAFRTEVRAVAGLDHPNVVQVLDHGTVPSGGPPGSGLAEGMPWLAMELVDGGTLSARRGRMAWPELRAVVLGLLDALAHAHARGVVHRDLKP